MYKHILVAVAPNEYDAYGSAFQVARELLASDGKLSVLTVVEEIPSYVDAYLPNDYRETNASTVKAELLDAMDLPDEDVHVCIGSVANSILEWSENADVDCIIVKSHRPGLSDYLLGSTAAKVVRHAKTCVHVLR